MKAAKKRPLISQVLNAEKYFFGILLLGVLLTTPTQAETEMVWLYDYQNGLAQQNPHYNSLIESLEDGSQLAFLNPRDSSKKAHYFTIDGEMLGEGRTARIYALKEFGDRVIRLPKSLPYAYTDDFDRANFIAPKKWLDYTWIGERIVDELGITHPKIDQERSIFSQFLLVEKIQDYMDFFEFIQMDSWQDHGRREQMREALLDLASRTAPIKEGLDFKAEQLYFKDGRWGLLDWNHQFQRHKDPNNRQSLFNRLFFEIGLSYSEQNGWFFPSQEPPRLSIELDLRQSQKEWLLDLANELQARIDEDRRAQHEWKRGRSLPGSTRFKKCLALFNRLAL